MSSLRTTRQMKKLQRFLEATNLSAIPQFKHIPLKLSTGKKAFLPAAHLRVEDVLDRYETLVGLKKTGKDKE